VAVADLNRDGRVDIALASPNGYVEVLLNNCVPGSRPVPRPGSVALNGTTAFVETPQVTIERDWTIELWFKDESPLGFNHEYATLLSTGERSTFASAPLFVTVGYKALVVGLRSDWTDHSLRYDLRPTGADPSAWHHVAASFESSASTLTVYFDGRPAVQESLGVAGRADVRPFQMGRAGPAAGKYFTGKVDDVRLWSLVRSDNDIRSNYGQALTSSPVGLVANWKFDDGGGSVAANGVDSLNGPFATLMGGAVFSSDFPSR
jgi:hypothetical protein